MQCEMTAVPPGLPICARGQSAYTILGNTKRPDAVPDITFSPLAKLAPEPISRKYQSEIDNFTTRHTYLKHFIVNDAFALEESGNTCTTLFFTKGAHRLVAFCALKCSSLLVKKRKTVILCPAVEIAALCVDDRYRYQGVGKAILDYTLQKVHRLRNTVGIQALTLFAIPNAVAFYKNYGFSEIESSMDLLQSPGYSRCIPMYLALGPM